MTDELLDLVNDKDEVIGKIWKSDAHKDPDLIHREVAIAVFDKKGGVLLQQRSMNKANDPGAWKIAAAGHVGKGEDPKDAIKREIYEELGIRVKPIYIKKEFARYKDKESRFFWIYYAVVNGKPKLSLDKDEVMDAKWVKIDDLEKFAKNNNYSLKSLSHKIIIELKNSLNL